MVWDRRLFHHITWTTSKTVSQPAPRSPFSALLRRQGGKTEEEPRSRGSGSVSSDFLATQRLQDGADVMCLPEINFLM
jgi:hypothetical protein